MRSIIFLFFITAVLLGSCTQNNTQNESRDQVVLEKVEISISGMSCTGCEQTITKATLALDGVKNATASFKEGKAWVSFENDKVTPEQLSASIEKTGYKVTDISIIHQ